MLIDIRAIGFGLTEGIRRHVESRLKTTLAPFAHRIVTVTARVEDVNAGRGGVDKRCSVVAAIRRQSVLVAEAVHVDLYAAADEAAARLRRSVQRQLSRHTARERRDPQRPGALAARGKSRAGAACVLKPGPSLSRLARILQILHRLDASVPA